MPRQQSNALRRLDKCDWLEAGHATRAKHTWGKTWSWKTSLRAGTSTTRVGRSGCEAKRASRRKATRILKSDSTSTVSPPPEPEEASPFPSPASSVSPEATLVCWFGLDGWRSVCLGEASERREESGGGASELANGPGVVGVDEGAGQHHHVGLFEGDDLHEVLQGFVLQRVGGGEGPRGHQQRQGGAALHDECSFVRSFVQKEEEEEGLEESVVSEGAGRWMGWDAPHCIHLFD